MYVARLSLSFSTPLLLDDIQKLFLTSGELFITEMTYEPCVIKRLTAHIWILCGFGLNFEYGVCRRQRLVNVCDDRTPFSKLRLVLKIVF